MEGIERDMILLVTKKNCPGCELAKPIYHEFFNKKETQYVIVDGSTEPDLMMALNVRAAPTLLFIKNREEVTRIVGVPKKEELELQFKNYTGDTYDEAI